MNSPWTELEGEFPEETSYSNALEYFEYRRSLAIMESEDEYENHHPDEPWHGGRNIMYHPNFAQAFAFQIGGQNSGAYQLSLYEVNHYLEKQFGQLNALEKPDCDYLIDALFEFYPVTNPKIERALKWLETKKKALPAWPPKYVKDLSGKLQRMPSNEDKSILPKAEGSVLLNSWTWQGTKGELVLVARMLIEADLVKVDTRNKTTFFQKMGRLFNIDLGLSPGNHMGSTRDRKTNRQIILDKLIHAFNEIMTEEKDKK